MYHYRLPIAFVAVSVVVIAVFLSQRPVKETSINERINASFARPIEISPKGKDFLVRFNGHDVLSKLVTVESGRNVDVVARFPPLEDPTGLKSQSMSIVPRLVSQGEDAFQWFDTRVDKTVSWSGNSLVDPHQEHPPKKKVRFNLRAGEYRLRFYLEIQPRDSEHGISEKYFLAESPLLVTGSPSEGVEPLDDPKNKFPVDIK